MGRQQLKKKSPGVFSSKKDGVLKAAYGDTGDIKFKCPSFGMYVECVPHSTDTDTIAGATATDHSGGGSTILRFHFFDRNASVNSGLSAILKASRNSEINAICADLSETKKKITNQAQETQIKNAITLAQEKGLLSGPWKNDETGKSYYSVMGGPPAIKNYLKNQMAYIQPGVQNSPISTFQIQTMHDAKLSTIHMLAAGKSAGGSETAPGEQDRGLPLRMNPSTATLQMLGCPLLSYGQQYFVDMGTNTTIDNIYTVVSVDHKLAPGKFTTGCKVSSR